jgi:four helix bundle protein
MGNTRPYDLEKRTYLFAKEVRRLIAKLPYSLQNVEDGKQIIRSSGSVGANYIEANEHVSGKDFQFRIKVCRKEAKESHYWLRLLQEVNDNTYKSEFIELIDEANQLKLIFNSMIKK